MLRIINGFTGTVCQRCSTPSREGRCPNCKTSDFLVDESEVFCTECFETYKTDWRDKTCLICGK